MYWPSLLYRRPILLAVRVKHENDFFCFIMSPSYLPWTTQNFLKLSVLFVAFFNSSQALGWCSFYCKINLKAFSFWPSIISSYSFFYFKTSFKCFDRSFGGDTSLLRISLLIIGINSFGKFIDLSFNLAFIRSFLSFIKWSFFSYWYRSLWLLFFILRFGSVSKSKLCLSSRISGSIAKLTLFGLTWTTFSFFSLTLIATLEYLGARVLSSFFVSSFGYS